MTLKNTSIQLVKIFTNRSLITQLSAVFLLMLVCWFACAYKFTSNLFDVQLMTQAETMVNNVEALNDHVSKYSRVWVKGDQFYSGNYIDRLPVSEGIVFYSKNPAMFVGEFSEQVYNKGTHARFKLTSIDPMNPKNTPNDYEKEVLNKITNTLQKDPEYRQIGSTFQYIKPIFYVESCLACHGDPKLAPQSIIKLYGDKNGFNKHVGEVAGAISVSIEIDKAKLVTDVLDWMIIVVFLASTLLFFFFVFRLTRYISLVSSEISSYKRGQPIGINTHTIDKDSSNELHGLIQSIAAVMELMEGTYKQVLMLTDRLKTADKKENDNAK